MRGWPISILAVLLGISLGLGAGCKGGGGATAAKQPTPKTSETKAATQGHEKESSGTKAEQSSTAEVAKLLGSSQPADQLHGLELVGKMKSDADRARLRDAVKRLCASDEPAVQVAALQTWIPWAKQDPEPALKAVGSPDPAVRIAATRVLAAAPALTARQALTKLKNDPDSSVAAAASAAFAEVVSSSPEDSAIDLLIADLGHPEGDRSALAGMKLEQRGRTDRRVIDRLMAALEAGRNAHQRMSCVVILGLTCAGTSEGQQKFGARTKATYRVQVNPAPGYTVPVPLLMKVVVKDPDPMVREAAAEALGHIGDPQSATALGRALRDPDADVRRRAASALIIVPPEPVKDEVITVAKKDPSAEVRRFAVEAAAGLSDQREAAVAVASCLRDNSADVRRYACEVLARIGTKQLTPALLSLFQDADEDVRWKAVEAVAGFVDPAAKDALADALWDPSPRVALAAERGLHYLGIGKRVLTAEERGGDATPQPK